jgi:NTP pyrophosphatase (non-canonical NTP hydrolase)
MNRDELLLVSLGEEACEVSHAVAKALRFGLTETYAKRGHDNAESIARELDDVLAMAEMLRERGLIPPSDPQRISERKLKFERWEAYSRVHGCVRDDPPKT